MHAEHTLQYFNAEDDIPTYLEALVQCVTCEKVLAFLSETGQTYFEEEVTEKDRENIQLCIVTSKALRMVGKPTITMTAPATHAEATT